MRTHYDNLNISENAPVEVIRAAYKALAMRFHPDRNDGSPESRRVMQILNEAYEVLSDPIRRKEYDRLILIARARVAQPTAPTSPSSSRPSAKSRPASKSRGIFIGILAFIFSDIRITILFIALTIWGFSSLTTKKAPSRSYSPSSTTPSYLTSTSTPSPTPTPRYTPTIPAKPKYIRPLQSPIGTNWPSSAGYVPGYQVQAQGGLSTVRIDNSRNSSDVFLKLVWLSASEAIPARMCYIPAYSSFTFSSVTAGLYDVRYRDLETGGLSKTEEFDLEEKKTYNGTSYSNLTLTLYKVANGNMTTEAIEESEF